MAKKGVAWLSEEATPFQKDKETTRQPATTTTNSSSTIIALGRKSECA